MRAGGAAPVPRCRRRPRASFVDESLFGSPAAARPPPPAFPPPWAGAPRPGPRPSGQRRLRGHTPSFCDESLFGPARAAPRMTKEDVAKLQALLWSPPPAPCTQPGPSRCCRSTPGRAEVSHRDTSCVWKRPGSEPCSTGTAEAQSLDWPSTPSDGPCRASDNPKPGRCKKEGPLTAPAAPRGPPGLGRSQRVSGPPLPRSSTAEGTCKARPPWK
ncbi:RBPJ-interacting and tubulin-associated protein 1 [Melopsittacus undulatus]|nr:RBPJ-interacting and tubulin-associated protein 1 [Melopsittacus undulatus]XP_033924197.1 RBPJ-interacting and tubulin-associated protein 1 [Melopsittacus undulatus]XP_033924198.1 RBPJ-interacting and tubulin-associated protein 1 [Melopsittacus undulatus]XP_033924199.1 RBPJ-interacting and tubulin-associated protein 1 [Melopsittacus undulatus]